jgi:hypothetical protein
MTIKDLINTRLKNQLISDSKFSTAEQIVSHLGAVQAQDYYGSLWAIGLRLKNSSQESIEKEIVNRKIVRTWPMRGTLHFVTAKDVRWMLKLLAPRIFAGSKRRHLQLELDEATFNRSREIFIRTLQGGNKLTRDEMYSLLESNNISAAGQRGIHILGKLAMEGVICFGDRQGKQQAFVLLDEWITNFINLNREESLAEITLRYFKSHGPATLQDFTWWSGLTAADTRTGLELVKSKLEQEQYNGRIFLFSSQKIVKNSSRENSVLLPAFDEYLVCYKDRSDVLDIKHKKHANAGGMLSPTIVVNGKVTGTWRRMIKNNKVLIEIFPFTSLNKKQHNKIIIAAEQYGRFINKTVILKLRK